MGLCLLMMPLSVAWVGMTKYVPWDENRTNAAVERQEELVSELARTIVATRLDAD